MDQNDKLKELMEEISKGATHMVATPDVIERMAEQGVPIQKKFIKYEDYIETLFDKKKGDALNFASQLPLLDETIADGVISEIFEEMRESHILGISSASITNAILLLEYAMRTRLFNERLKSNPKTEWSDLEKLDMDALIQNLFRLKIVSSDEKIELANFSKTFRNPYFHINMHKLTKDMVIERLPGVNIRTLEKIEMKDVKVSEHRFLWFAAKRVFDKFQAKGVINYCVDWTNKLLRKDENEI
jgi:hypothetical protein